jgi:hypothetical protein
MAILSLHRSTLAPLHLKTNIIPSNLRLVWLAHLGRHLTARVLAAELRGDPQLDELLRLKDRINRQLARELECLKQN